MDNCRYLWRRISQETKRNHGELKAVWEIGKSLFLRNPAQAHTAMSNYSWSEPVQPYVTKLQEEVRARTFALLSRAYTNISLHDMRTHLGLAEEAAIQLAQNNRWDYNEDDQMFMPRADLQHSPGQSESSVTMRRLVDIALFLEKD